MKKHFTGFLALLTALLLAVPVFAGCGSAQVPADTAVVFEGEVIPEDVAKLYVYTTQLDVEKENEWMVMLYYGDRNDGCDVCVPEKLGGLTVTAIANSAFQGRDYLETVELPETVMLVDDMAFHQCSSLRSVKLHEGVVMLGKSCFGGCVSLENLELPESLEIVGEFAFLQCLKLHEIRFGENLKEIRANAFVLCDSLKRITIPRDADVDERAFTGIPEDTEIVFSE